MSTNIDSRISPALHPLNVREVDGYGEDTALVLGPTETAFSAAYEGVRDVLAAREKVERNLALTPEGRLIQLDDFARKHLDRITRNFDGVRANLEKGIAHLEQELSQPVESRAAGSIAGEVRRHLKALPTGERMKVIRDAIDTEDVTVASAALGAPAMLSGIDAKTQAVLIRMYHEKANPALARRLTAMTAAKRLIEQRAALVFDAMTKAVGASPHKVKALREAKTEAEKALILKDVA